jgi:translation initiation factor IF-1
MLKALADGRERIIAVAERKIRLRPGDAVRLTTNDFLTRR